MTTQDVETTTVDQYIGERVHALAWRQRVTQRALANALDVTPGTISRKIRGERPWAVSELVDVANALGVSMSELTEGVEGVRPKGFEPLTFWLGVSAGQSAWTLAA